MKYLIPLLLIGCINKSSVKASYIDDAVEDIVQCINGCLTAQEICKAFNPDDDMKCQIDASKCIKICQTRGQNEKDFLSPITNEL